MTNRLKIFPLALESSDSIWPTLWLDAIFAVGVQKRRREEDCRSSPPCALFTSGVLGPCQTLTYCFLQTLSHAHEAVLPHPDTDTEHYLVNGLEYQWLGGLHSLVISHFIMLLIIGGSFQPRSFQGAGGQLVQFEDRENMDEQKTKIPGRRNEIMSCVPNHITLF